MQFKAVALASFAAVAAAQDISSLVSQFPSCSTKCLSDASTNIGCAATDFACQCGKIADFTSNVTPCLLSSCNTDDNGKVQTVAAQICAAVAGSAAATPSYAVSSAAASPTSTPVTAAAPRGVEAGLSLMGAAALAAFAL